MLFYKPRVCQNLKVINRQRLPVFIGRVPNFTKPGPIGSLRKRRTAHFFFFCRMQSEKDSSGRFLLTVSSCTANK